MVVSDVSKLATEGFVRVAYPASLRSAVRNAMNAWERFCALPNDTKKQISYSGDKNVSGVGYELKLERGATNDLKEDFHLRLSEREFLLAEAAKVGPEVVTFVDMAEELNCQVAPVVEEFAKAVEDQFGLSRFVVDVAEKQPRALIRFLHYFGDRKPGEELAVPHVDKGGFTLHLYESHPGLEHLTYDRVWAPMDFSEKETAIIPAMRMQLRSENKLKATCHRVVANTETAKTGRYSAVCFVDFANTPYYDKVRCGRLQDREAGFNYAMPLPEFSKLFTS